VEAAGPGDEVQARREQHEDQHVDREQRHALAQQRQQQ